MFRPAVSARMARSIIADGPQYHRRWPRGWGRPGVSRSMRADGGALAWAAVSARRPARRVGAAEVTNLGKLELGNCDHASGR